MRLSALLALLSLIAYVGAQEERTPLVALELSPEALAQHLGVRSWAFSYNTSPGEFVEVRLLFYERGQHGEWINRYLGFFSVQSDPSGQQLITFLIGPAGRSVTYSLGINTAVSGGTLDGVELESFNIFAANQLGAVLPPTGEAQTFILMSRYSERNGSVTATGNPDDMDAYLALEIGQGGP